MRNTIKDVAFEAGVSVATVSRVLNGKDRVNEQTRIKVKQAIEKLNFKPDHTARSLSNNKTMSVGLIVPNMTNEYWALLSQSIEERLWESGYSLVLSTTNNVLEREIAGLSLFMDRKVEGLIFGKNVLVEKKHYKDILENAKIPIVSFESGPLGQIQITSDGLYGAMTAVQHLIQLGHKHIVYIGVPSLIDEREMGYRNALISNGLEVDQELIIKGIPSLSLGKEAVTKLILSRKKFTAIFCWNDLTAFGVIKALMSYGIQVPRDVAVVGYDNIEMAEVFSPSLTTISQPIKEMGMAAVDYLLSYINNSDEQMQGHKKIAFQTTLIIRESCGAKQVQHEYAGKEGDVK